MADAFERPSCDRSERTPLQRAGAGCENTGEDERHRRRCGRGHAAHAARAGRSVKQSVVDGRTYLFVDEPKNARTSLPQIDLVHCYDESIIAYGESRDVLRTVRARFVVPAMVNGYTHVILRDGTLLGHWRV